MFPVAAATSSPSTGVSPDGAWTYFTEPRAVNYEGGHRRTYVAWIDSRGQIVVASYDHGTDVRTRVVLRTGERVDDHNNPSLIVRPDGRILVFYSVDRRRELVSRLSRRPEDVRAWSRPHRVRTNIRGRHGYTYPNPVWLRRERRPLFLFWRGGSFEPAYSTSRRGASWSRARRLIAGAGQRPYPVFDSNGRDRIDIAFSDGNPSEHWTGIHYMRYRDGRLERADGTRITRLGERPVAPSEADVVYEGREGRPPAWAYDVGVDRDGSPVILYATFHSATEHRYYYARWTGVRWLSRELARTGPTISSRDPNYAGGLVFDSRDSSVVYLSRAVGGDYQIERWATADRGLNWKTTPVTSGAADNYRPVSVLGPAFGAHYDLFWMRGPYADWLDFGTSIRTRLRTDLGRVPDASFDATRRGRRAFALAGAPARRRTWDFGDGTAMARGQRVTHSYGDHGRYRVVSTAFGRRGARVRRDVFVRELRARR